VGQSQPADRAGGEAAVGETGAAGTGPEQECGQFRIPGLQGHERDPPRKTRRSKSVNKGEKNKESDTGQDAAAAGRGGGGGWRMEEEEEEEEEDGGGTRVFSN